jgi:hypothetical protein
MILGWHEPYTALSLKHGDKFAVPMQISPIESSTAGQPESIDGIVGGSSAKAPPLRA